MENVISLGKKIERIKNRELCLGREQNVWTREQCIKGNKSKKTKENICGKEKIVYIYIYI